MNDADRLAILANAAAARVEPGSVIGLGSGSTTEAVIAAIGKRITNEDIQVSGVPTSLRTERAATTAGIRLVPFDDFPRLYLGIDGADEIDPQLKLVKGRGGALLPEKLLALSCDHYLIVAADEKLVDKLGSRIGVPVEVAPFGWRETAARVAATGLSPTLRMGSDGSPFVTDSGHYILDCSTEPIDDPEMLATQLKGITGVIDHGLFIGIADEALVVDKYGEVMSIRPTSV